MTCHFNLLIIMFISYAYCINMFTSKGEQITVSRGMHDLLTANLNCTVDIPL